MNYVGYWLENESGIGRVDEGLPQAFIHECFGTPRDDQGTGMGVVRFQLENPKLPLADPVHPHAGQCYPVGTVMEDGQLLFWETMLKDSETNRQHLERLKTSSVNQFHGVYWAVLESNPEPSLWLGISDTAMVVTLDKAKVLTFLNEEKARGSTIWHARLHTTAEDREQLANQSFVRVTRLGARKIPHPWREHLGWRTVLDWNFLEDDVDPESWPVLIPVV